MGYNHFYHLHCVYRELQLPFIPFLSLSLAYVGNILVHRYRPLTTLLCSHFLYAYPAVRLSLCALTLLCSYFLYAYLAVALFILLRTCFILRRICFCCALAPYPAVPLFFFTLTQLYLSTANASSN